MCPRTAIDEPLAHKRTTTVSEEATLSGSAVSAKPRVKRSLVTALPLSRGLDSERDDALADADLVFVRQLLLLDRHTVDPCAVDAVEVFDPEVAVLPHDA